MKNISSKEIVYLGIFISMEVMLTRFLSIQTPVVRIGFTFLPIAVSAIMFGAVFSGTSAALADLVGMMLFPSGTYFPGFTLTAFLSGTIYGAFLYNKTVNIFRICAAVVVTSVLISMGLDTLWIWMLTGKGIMLLLPARIIKSLIMIPVQVATIELTWRLVVSRIRLSYTI